MKILLLDIETVPNVGYMWKLWDESIGPKQLIESHRVVCWAAKWYGKNEMIFKSEYKDGRKNMLKAMHKLMSEADMVVHYYGSKFDVPMLNAEFVREGFAPPAPYKQVDLKQVVSNNFKFPSSKLEYVAKALGLGEKISTTFELWLGVLENDKASWQKMELYNKQDTRLLERLYNKLMPWIKNHPNHGAYQEDKEVCPNCGSKHVHKRGTVVARLLSYTRYQCQSCDSWFRSNKPIDGKKKHRYVAI